VVRDSNDSQAVLRTDLRGDPANGQAARDRSGRAPAKALVLGVGKLVLSLQALRPDLETYTSKATSRTSKA
jgi:hypothetical protein